MRMKNNELVKQWINNCLYNGSNHNGSFRIEEGRAYTYNVLLGYFKDGMLFLNIKKYSPTSSRHRNLIKTHAEARGIQIMECMGFGGRQ